MDRRHTTERAGVTAAVGRVGGRPPALPGVTLKPADAVRTTMDGTERTGEFRCEICGKTFESGAALERHVRAVGLVD